MMTPIQFEAPEYQQDGSFQRVPYAFHGDERTGWKITRNGKCVNELGPGYALVETQYCGICSTDLARKFLPYPLPQIIGHEVVGRFKQSSVVVEINASHQARAYHFQQCPYCANGMPTQCPERITLGINQLPGGFAPYFLAPVNAIFPIPAFISPQSASFTEPFAAALHGVEVTYPQEGDQIAVLGPRRLGMLIIAALAGFRKQTGISFGITGLVRHESLVNVGKAIGADQMVRFKHTELTHWKEKFDVVYDTTGSPEGLETALQLTKRVVHLKSTHGQSVMGMTHLTDMVVEEIALLPYRHEHLNYTWPLEPNPRKNANIFVSCSVPNDLIIKAKQAFPEIQFHQLEILQAKHLLEHEPERLSPSQFPRFDLAIVTTPQEADQVLRPVAGQEYSLLRARGAILLAGDKGNDSFLFHTVKDRNIEIHTSRCGNFSRTLNLLQDNPEIAPLLEHALITHQFPLSRIEEAFQIAADSKSSIKVVMSA